MSEAFKLVKRQGRLIVEKDGEFYYTPPDWLRPYVHGRNMMQILVDGLNEGHGISGIVAFETILRPNP